MKYLFWPIPWILFGMGHAASLALNWVSNKWPEYECGWMYTVYNRLMLASSGVQDYFGFKSPWGPANSKSTEEGWGLGIGD